MRASIATQTSSGAGATRARRVRRFGGSAAGGRPRPPASGCRAGPPDDRRQRARGLRPEHAVRGPGEGAGAAAEGDRVHAGQRDAGLPQQPPSHRAPVFCEAKAPPSASTKRSWP
ncbi:hypothetical protein Ddc_24586 [Ditylenchus destructor]|nr:hypothetical protein Ddc_24586 [Ditylenchus destructor]